MDLNDKCSLVVGTGLGVMVAPIATALSGHVSLTALFIAAGASAPAMIATAVATGSGYKKANGPIFFTSLAAGAAANLFVSLATPMEFPQPDTSAPKVITIGELAAPGKTAGSGPFKFSLA